MNIDLNELTALRYLMLVGRAKDRPEQLLDSRDYNLIIDLIDAAIADQSRQESGDDVEEAIAYLKSDFDYQSRCECDICTPGKKHFDLIIRILTAYRQPAGCKGCSEYTYSQCKVCGDAYIDNKGFAFCPYCGEAIESED